MQIVLLLLRLVFVCTVILIYSAASWQHLLSTVSTIEMQRQLLSYPVVSLLIKFSPLSMKHSARMHVGYRIISVLHPLGSVLTASSLLLC